MVITPAQNHTCGQLKGTKDKKIPLANLEKSEFFSELSQNNSFSGIERPLYEPTL